MIKPCPEKILVNGGGLGLKVVQHVVAAWKLIAISSCGAQSLFAFGNSLFLTQVVLWTPILQMFSLYLSTLSSMFLGNVGVFWSLPFFGQFGLIGMLLSSEILVLI